jgi:hypothetical protein
MWMICSWKARKARLGDDLLVCPVRDSTEFVLSGHIVVLSSHTNFRMAIGSVASLALIPIFCPPASPAHKPRNPSVPETLSCLQTSRSWGFIQSTRCGLPARVPRRVRSCTPSAREHRTTKSPRQQRRRTNHTLRQCAHDSTHTGVLDFPLWFPLG